MQRHAPEEDATVLDEATLLQDDYYSRDSITQTQPHWGRLVFDDPQYPTVVLQGSMVSIGRQKKNSVILSVASVSSIHCSIHRDEKGVFIRDRSTNGTYVGDRKVGKNKRLYIENGARVALSRPSSKSSGVKFTVYLGGPETVDDGGFSRRYQLQKTLGKGAFATVSLAIHKETGMQFALKLIDKQSIANSRAVRAHSHRVASLMDEVSILAKLDHPGVVKVYDVFESSQHLFLVLELVPGGDLMDLLVALGKPLGEARSRQVVTELLSAMLYLHSQGVVHRDLKPENILVTTNDPHTFNIKITDFGLSRQNAQSEMTTVCGTPMYAAPEIILAASHTESGYQGYSKAVDVWSVGVTLYIMLYGRTPFNDDPRMSLPAQIVQGRYTLFESVSQGARHLCAALLCVDPRKRITLEQALRHPWLLDNPSRQVRDECSEDEAQANEYADVSPVSDVDASLDTRCVSVPVDINTPPDENCAELASHALAVRTSVPNSPPSPPPSSRHTTSSTSFDGRDSREHDIAGHLQYDNETDSGYNPSRSDFSSKQTSDMSDNISQLPLPQNAEWRELSIGTDATESLSHTPTTRTAANDEGDSPSPELRSSPADSYAPSDLSLDADAASQEADRKPDVANGEQCDVPADKQVSFASEMPSDVSLDRAATEALGDEKSGLSEIGGSEDGQTGGMIGSTESVLSAMQQGIPLETVKSLQASVSELALQGVILLDKAETVETRTDGLSDHLSDVKEDGEERFQGKATKEKAWQSQELEVTPEVPEAEPQPITPKMVVQEQNTKADGDEAVSSKSVIVRPDNNSQSSKSVIVRPDNNSQSVQGKGVRALLVWLSARGLLLAVLLLFIRWWRTR